LAIKIESKTYENTLINQTNFDKTVPAKIQKQAKLAVKDGYIFSFLELAEDHNEREFEKAIFSRMDKFLREMGGAITFVGSQYKLVEYTLKESNKLIGVAEYQAVKNVPKDLQGELPTPEQIAILLQET
jgi:hypothetical protein